MNGKFVRSSTRRFVPVAILAASACSVFAIANDASAIAISGPETSDQLIPNSENADASTTVGLLKKQDYDRALEAASALIRERPDSPAGYNLMGGAYAGKNDRANARANFEKALAIQHDYVPALLNLAQLDLQENDAARAEKRYQTILANDAKNIDAMAGMAKVEASRHREKESAQWLERARTENPAALAPRLLLAQHYVSARNYPQALTELNEALRIRPDDPGVMTLIGQVQLAAGQTADAVATYGKLVSRQPQSPVAYFWLAAAQARQLRLTDAAVSLRTALKLKPDYVEAVDALAALELRAGRNGEALKLARQLQLAAPQSPAGFALQGDVLMTQQRYADAGKAYEQALSKNETGLLEVKLHSAQTRAGKSNAADARLAKWLEAHPNDLRVRQYRATEYMRTGQTKAAIDEYQRVVKGAPRDVVALNNLANLYQRVGDRRALESAEEAFRLAPASATIADTLGWILVEQDKVARGLELLQMAAGKAPDNAEIRYHFAAALAKSGDKAKARTELEKLLAGDRPFPQRQDAQALLKRL